MMLVNGCALQISLFSFSRSILSTPKPYVPIPDCEGFFQEFKNEEFTSGQACKSTLDW
jgi:hypothetical protein